MNNLTYSFNLEALQDAKSRLQQENNTQLIQLEINNNNYTKTQRNTMILSLFILISFGLFLGAVSITPDIIQVAFKLL